MNLLLDKDWSLNQQLTILEKKDLDQTVNLGSYKNLSMGI